METNILSMLEFSCLIQENEQTVFESLLESDFSEAYMNLNETEGNEKSFLDKAKEAAKNVWDKILAMLKEFKNKITEWIQLVRKKFGDLIKADQKISKHLEKVTPEMIKDWKVPKDIHIGLAFQVICTNHKKNAMTDYYMNILDADEEARNIINEFTDKVTDFKAGKYYDDMRAFDEIKKLKEEYMKKLEECMADYDIMHTIVSDINDKSDSGYVASDDNKEKDLSNVKNILANKYDLTNTMIRYFELTKKTNSSLAHCVTLARDNNDGNTTDEGKEASNRLIVAEGRAIKDLADFYMNKTTKMYHNLMSLNARAYADIRKYALGAINFAAKHNDIENMEAPSFALVPVSASYIYDASDEYVFEALGLVV